jgi:hypothetical protein
MRNDFYMATSRREELLELIAAAADEIASIDRSLPVLYSQSLQANILQSEEKFRSKIS